MDNIRVEWIEGEGVRPIPVLVSGGQLSEESAFALAARVRAMFDNADVKAGRVPHDVLVLEAQR